MLVSRLTITTSPLFSFSFGRPRQYGVCDKCQRKQNKNREIKLFHYTAFPPQAVSLVSRRFNLLIRGTTVCHPLFFFLAPQFGSLSFFFFILLPPVPFRFYRATFGRGPASYLSFARNCFLSSFYFCFSILRFHSVLAPASVWYTIATQQTFYQRTERRATL